MTKTAMPDLSLPLTFDPHLHLREIVLIGCGGTGSHLARLIARLLVHVKALNLSVPTFHIVDPDVVEPKNLGRQLYTQAELGLPKAEATARRLSCALGLSVQWSAAAFDAILHVSHPSSTLIIDAVDNHEPRQAISQLRNVTVLACGNERTHGQVTLGNTSHIADVDAYLETVIQNQKRLGDKFTLSTVPTAYALFPSLLEPEPPPRVVETPESCAERLLLGEQDLYINDTIALIAARYVQQLILRQPIQSILTFATLEEMLTIRPIPLTLASLRVYLDPK